MKRSIGAQVNALENLQQTPFVDVGGQTPFARRKTMPARHTPFGRGVAVTGPEGSRGAVWGESSVIMAIPRSSGDVIGALTLQIDLPALASPGARWVPLVGLVLVRRAALKLGDAVLQDVERQFAYLYWRHSSTPNAWNTIKKMAGGDDPSGLSASTPQTVYIPLPFLTHKRQTPSQTFLPTLPLVSGNEPLEVHLQLENFEKCLLLSVGTPLPAPVPPLSITLTTEVIALSSAERAALIRYPTTLMFDTILDCETVSFRGDGSGRTPLRELKIELKEINQCVKMLFIVLYSTLSAKTPGSYFQYLSPNNIESVTLTANGKRLDSATAIPPEVYRLMVPYALSSEEHPFMATPDAMVITHSFLPFANSQCGWLDYSSVSNPTLELKFGASITDAMLVADAGITVKVYAVCVNQASISSRGSSTLFV